jgi:hypothetical protein
MRLPKQAKPVLRKMSTARIEGGVGQSWSLHSFIEDWEKAVARAADRDACLAACITSPIPGACAAYARIS